MTVIGSKVRMPTLMGMKTRPETLKPQKPAGKNPLQECCDLSRIPNRSSF
jgi:hypothetical protein